MSVDSYLHTLLDVRTVLKASDCTLYLEGYIGWVVMNVQNKPVNVLGPALTEQTIHMLDTIEQLIKNDQIRLVIFTSGKHNSFIAGADIDILYPLTDQSGIYQLSRTGQQVFDRIEQLPVITVAVMNGAALGGGLELALSCDYRVLSDTNKSVIGLPEIKLGLLPGAGGTQRLPRLIGLQKSLPLILAGAQVKPQKALQLKIVDQLLHSMDNSDIFFVNARSYAIKLIGERKPSIRHYTAHKLQDRMLENTAVGNWIIARQAGQGLDKQTKAKYPASYYALDSVVNGYRSNGVSGYEYEAKQFSTLAVSPESKALTSLFYMFENSKKVSDKLNGSRPSRVNQLGVIGAGVMGWQISGLVANKHINVYMRDIKQDIVQKGIQHITDGLNQKLARKRTTTQKMNKILSYVTGGTDIQPLNKCELIIEAAVELMPLKKRILAEIESVIDSSTIFATNTSSLSITELATASKRPENVVGIHFFNPVNKMPLVEIIRGKHTSDQTVATAYKFALDLGKIPVICHDGPGFIVNRILGIYMNEAGHLAMQGCDIETIDSALLSFGMPMGPFRLIDEVGLDVAGHVAPILHNGLGERYAQQPEFPKLLEANKSYLGKKTGKGFYIYDGEKQKGIHHNVVNQLKSIAKPYRGTINKSDIIDRCILLQVNEAAYVLSEGIVSSPADLDLAMVTGTGFAPFTGGVCAYADMRGLQNIVARLTVLQERFGPRFKPHPLLIKMASNGARFHSDRPDPNKLKHIPRPLPYSKL